MSTASQEISGGMADTLRPFVERGVLAGAVCLVANKEKVLALEAVGYSDVAAKTLMRTDALFWVASQSKPITCTAMMLLVDEGKVDINDPVEKYLPEFKLQMLQVVKDETHMLLRKPAHPITVREIMSHTSGMGFCTPMETPTLDGLPLSVAVRSHPLIPLNFEPGTNYLYSNMGTNAVGRIIEVVSGMPYEAFLAKRLFEPLGMVDTSFVPTEAQVRRLAKTYQPDETKTSMREIPVPQLKQPYSGPGRYPFPAGGLFSTAIDCGRFCQMLLNGGEFEGRRYISDAALKQMTRRHTPPTIEARYGLGWAEEDEGFSHGGALATNMAVNVKKGVVTVFLVQHAGFPGDGNTSHAAFKKAAETKFGS